MLLEQILGHDNFFRVLGVEASILIYLVGGLFYTGMGILALCAIVRRKKNRKQGL